ncbi:MAG: DUF61 family protein [Candidatus Syntropharchaeia archaeon]
MRYEDRIISKTVQSLNRHLPEKRKDLSTLLSEERPGVLCKDGSFHRFKRDELERIAEIVPKEYHKKISLPLYIEIAPDYGRGAARIRGRIYCEIVRSVLGREGNEEEMIIYRPEVRELRKNLPTTTQYAFFVSI